LLFPQFHQENTVIPIYRVMSLILVVGVGVEFFLAGAGAFGATSFDAHRALGMALLAVSAVTIAFAVGCGRSPQLPFALTALLVVQFVLGYLGRDHAWIGAVHGLTAAAVAAVAFLSARRALA
jgi:hypothetical protein